MENQTVTEKLVFSRVEAAAYLGIHRNTLDRSKIPRIHIGARTLFRKQTLDKYLTDIEKKWKSEDGRTACGK